MSIDLIIVIILIPITILLMGIGIFIYRKIRIQMKRDKKINKIKNKLNIEIVSRVDKTITRISLIAKKNPKYVKLYENLKIQFQKIDSLSKETNLHFSSLVDKKYLLKSKEFKDKITSLEKSINFLEKLGLNFKKLTEYITQQEKFLSSEFLFYSSHLRSVIEIYRFKRITMDSISAKVDLLASNIKAKGKEFNEYIIYAENSLASKALKEYTKLIIKFSKIISEAPTINIYINETIKKVINKIATLYVRKKEELNTSMDHISFQEEISKISKIYKRIKNKYHNLELDSCKKDIILVLKATKSLERLINYEIKSKNFFTPHYPIIKKEISKSVKYFKEIKKNIRLIVEKGEIIPQILINPMNKAEKIKEDIYNLVKDLNKMAKTNLTPFSLKMKTLKCITKKTDDFIETLNALVRGMWEHNIETANIINKYKKANAAINELLANINSKTLKLKSEKWLLLKGIEKEINQIALKINSNSIDEELKSSVNMIMGNTTDLYNSVMGDIMIADITSNLIKHLAPQRALDNSLNFSLNKAEREYVDSEYSQSLNTIIDELEGGE